MVNRIEIQHSRRTGSAIVIILMATVIVTLLGAAMLRVGLGSRVLAIRNCQAAEARCAADAGLTKALYRMNERLRNRTWSDSDPPGATNAILHGADATFSYTVSGNDTTGYSVQSVGNRNQSQASVSATLRLKSLFDYAILSQSLLSIKTDTTISGYNSQDAGDTDVDLEVVTTSTLADQMILNSGVNIDGDVMVGVGGDPATVIKDQGATTGDRSALTEEVEFVVITPPALSAMGLLDIKGTNLTIGPADSGQYTSITLAQTSEKVGGVTTTTPAILEIAGGEVVIHVTGDIIVGESCEILIASGSSLILYVDGNVDCRANSNIGYQGLPQEPEHMKIYGTGSGLQSFNLNAKSFWSGAIYAPNADIVMKALGDIYGSFIGNSFDLKSGADVCYDEALRDVSVYDEGVRFEIKHWHDN